MKRFNFNKFLWLLILIGFLLSIGFLFFSGKIFLLVAEKMNLYIIFTLICLCLFFLIEISEVFTVPSRGGIKRGYIFFVLTIICFLVVSRIDILKNSLRMKGVVVEHSGHNHVTGHAHNHDKDIQMADDETIIVEKDNFHNAIEIINSHIENYIDKDIIIEGLLYNNDINTGDFVITQIDMNCCMVDSSFLGITCIGEVDSEIETGDYVKAKGKIKIVDYNGHKLGAVEINELNKYNK